MGRVLGRSMCNSFKEQKEAEIGEREREKSPFTPGANNY
jgi:hypothetical protein